MVLLLPVFAPAMAAINSDQGSKAEASKLVIAPSITSKTAFAIITDSLTYVNVRSGIEAYKAAVERDGLGTYIIAANWETPDEVKSQLITLSKGEIPLEGAVFVGDIPIVMSREAQHLASAFTAIQSKVVTESTIATDRFYDDFDLKWDFICRDTNNKSLFYYALRFDSPQAVKTDIYSARIRATGDDKYSKLDNYFKKAVAAHNEKNKLDNLFMFRGTSYNSETYDGWSGEQIVLREQLPQLFLPGSTVRFVDFDTYYPVKPYVLEYLRYPGLDVVLGHHHGSDSQQYLNDDMKAYTVSEAIELVSRQARAKIWRSKDKAAALKRYAAEYGIPECWIDTTAAQRERDKEYAYAKDIHIEEVYEYKPSARFVMFDACDNGSFFLDDCIASAYIFSDGGTVVTQANSIGSIQDKHPNAYLGLLAHGLRVGQWSRYAQSYLGSHIIGDPTYRFANTSGNDTDINELVALSASDNDLWLGILASSAPKGNIPALGCYDENSCGSDLKALAVRMLSDNNYPDIAQLAFDLYKKSPYGSVRMECIKALYVNRPQSFANSLPTASENTSLTVQALVLAMNDTYELVRRFATEYIGTCGDAELLPALANAAINDRISARVEYRAKDNLKVYPLEVAVAEIDRQFQKNSHLLDPDGIKSSILSARTWADENFAKMLSLLDRVQNVPTQSDSVGLTSVTGEKFYGLNKKEAEDCLRILTQLRNSNCHYVVPQIIEFIENDSKPMELRVDALEVLGWFNASYRNPEITALCHRLLQEKRDHLKDSSGSNISSEAEQSYSDRFQILLEEAQRTLERMRKISQ